MTDPWHTKISKFDIAILPFALLGLFICFAIPALIYLDTQEQLGRETTNVAPELADPIDFEAEFGPATFRSHLGDQGDPRIKELQLLLPSDADAVLVAVQSPSILESTGNNGIAVRTTTQATIIRHNERLSVSRPLDCPSDCQMIVWLTMGQDFNRLHPDAEVLVYAGDGAEVVMEDVVGRPDAMN